MFYIFEVYGCYKESNGGFNDFKKRVKTFDEVLIWVRDRYNNYHYGRPAPHYQIVMISSFSQMKRTEINEDNMNGEWNDFEFKLIEEVL
jgi:hypothetical protein